MSDSLKPARAGASRARADASPLPYPAPGGEGPSTPADAGPGITAQDLYLFNEGTHARLHQVLGVHPWTQAGQSGQRCSVWAPNATYVAVVGDFNGWDRGAHALEMIGATGIWSGFVPGMQVGDRYKFHVASRMGNYASDRADPFAAACEIPPGTASVVSSLDYDWSDAAWMATRWEHNALQAPWSIYEVHLGSWMRVPEDGYRSLSYRELADKLGDYVVELGFTHVELLPVMEHPFFGSWGYQTTGYFAPSSRYGSPQDFMYLIDSLHQRGIGVILDWVPSHFPGDGHALAYFDGTHLYEHADPRQGFHPDWSSFIFNYGRNEVRSFLLSSAMCWLERYHVDSIRVDAVASMLYLDYSRKSGEWIPNQFGGRENLEAIGFLRQLNERIYHDFPDVQTIAEESTSWPMVSRPLYLGGLGFGMKWDMGWMHDTLEYFGYDAIHRSYHHNLLTFRMLYAYHENFVLPLSHDEVVYGKGSLLNKMPGDPWQKFATLRALLGYMYGQSGKKLVFMGAEIGQWSEWNHDGSLDWHLLENEPHRGLHRWTRDLNHTYQTHSALWARDFESGGFEWVDCNDAAQSIVSFLRWGPSADDCVLVVCNFTPVVRHNYLVGCPFDGVWQELLNSDAEIYGGSGQGNLGRVTAKPELTHGRPYALPLTLPPLSVLFFARVTE